MEKGVYTYICTKYEAFCVRVCENKKTLHKKSFKKKRQTQVKKTCETVFFYDHSIFLQNIFVKLSLIREFPLLIFSFSLLN